MWRWVIFPHLNQFYCYKSSTVSLSLASPYLGTHILREMLQSRQCVSQFYLVLAVQQHTEQCMSCAWISYHLAKERILMPENIPQYLTVQHHCPLLTWTFQSKRQVGQENRHCKQIMSAGLARWETSFRHIQFLLAMLLYRDGAGNTSEETSSIFSLIWMR